MGISIKFYLYISDGVVLKDPRFIHHLYDLIELLKKQNNDVLIFGNVIVDSMPVWQWMYSTDCLSREDKELLGNILSKNTKTSSFNTTEELLKTIINADKDCPQGLFGDQNFVSNSVPNKFIYDENSYYKLKQFYAKQYSNNKIYKYLPECFPNVRFNEDDSAYSLSKFSAEDIDELFSIIYFLNDMGIKIFEMQSHNVDATIKIYNSTNGFICTGGKLLKMNIKINSENKLVTCSAHFKIQNSHSNKRMYFTWGVKQIIVCYIGGHLK